MTDGILWCPHCRQPHKLSDRFCTTSGKALDSSIHLAAKKAQSPLIGATIDHRYKVLSLLGEGGMAEVYEAENLLLRRRVAIKVVSARRRISSDEAGIRLQRECQAVAAIQHPNICDIYDTGFLPDGSPYLVLERLVGETLAQRQRRRRRFSATAAVEVFSQVLSALRAAHSVGIIHRDLKPANIFMVERPGCAAVVKVLDFGFAKTTPVGPNWAAITKPGRVCGTPQYMAPEQLRAEEIDGRADLFTVGVIFYEMLTGHHPFHGDSLVEIGTRILRDQPVPLNVARPSLPRAFADFTSRALAKDRAARFQSAADMQVALMSLAEDDGPTSESYSDTLSRLPRMPPSSPTPSGY